MALTIHYPHAWNVTPQAAVEIQRTLAPLVREEPLPHPPQTIGGVDMSVRGDEAQAAVVVLRLPDFAVMEEATWRGPVDFPYVPGLLSFREAPAVLRALEQLQTLPDLIMADAQGIAHPRRLGLAAHLGVLLDWPVIGVAKTRLLGRFDEPAPERGSTRWLYDRQTVIGAVVRTRTATQPLYVSMGHRITLAEAVEWTLACALRYRLPEPTRLAHLLSRRAFSEGEPGVG
jgi:deoxyribonuclease V